MNGDEFRGFSPYTDPGEFAFLLDGLPSSLESISDIVHAQLVHPGRAPELVTEGNRTDEETCQTVRDILATLQERNPIGLSLDRQPHHRVYVNCCGFSQLMTSILKSQAIPSRVRCGFSLYPFDGFSCDHTVLEAWIHGQWRLIDASDASTGSHFKLYDMPGDVFHFGWQAWQRVRGGFDPIDRYCVAPAWVFPNEVRWQLLHKALIRDMIALFGHEIQVFSCPPFRDMTDEEAYPTLDRIATLMASPDRNRDQIREFCEMLVI